VNRSDLELLEETALAVAQATIQNSMDEAGIGRAELARRMGRARSYVTRLLRGDHNLTVKTLARALGACGQQIWLDSVSPQCSWAAARPHVEALMDKASGAGYRAESITEHLVIAA
jgi:transcriptional regulator with XRE-family HTH domain